MSSVSFHRKREDGFVYLVRPKADGTYPVKIGWSTNPWAESWGGQRWTWFPLEVWQVVSIPLSDPFHGTHAGSLERFLHDAFKPLRVQREWFQRTALVELLAELAAAKAPPLEIAQTFVAELRGWELGWWSNRIAECSRRAS